MRKQYFLGNPRARRGSKVWIDDWPEGDDVGVYNKAHVFNGRGASYQYMTPEYAIELGQALIKAGERAQELQRNRDRRGRKYLRRWKTGGKENERPD